MKKMQVTKKKTEHQKKITKKKKKNCLPTDKNNENIYILDVER